MSVADPFSAAGPATCPANARQSVIESISLWKNNQMRIPCQAALIFLMISSGLAAAKPTQAVSGEQRTAQILARCMDESAVAIAHADLGRVDVVADLTKLAGFIGEGPQGELNTFAATIDALHTAGQRPAIFYAVFNLLPALDNRNPYFARGWSSRARTCKPCFNDCKTSSGVPGDRHFRSPRLGGRREREFPGRGPAPKSGTHSSPRVGNGRLPCNGIRARSRWSFFPLPISGGRWRRRCLCFRPSLGGGPATELTHGHVWAAGGYDKAPAALSRVVP